MPNTLAHIAINAVVTRSVIKKADLKWIYLGIVIPDLPWILQRVLKVAAPSIDLYDLRLYCVVQSSLLFCLVLSAAFSALSKHPARCFAILSIGSLLHLILDAFQIKWANGVNMLAPFDWQLWNTGWFWPESYFTYALTALGFCYFLFYSREALSEPWDIQFLPLPRILTAIVFIALYFLLPIALLNGPAEKDAHYVSTLRGEDRHDKYIEFDRAKFIASKERSIVKPFTGNEFTINNLPEQGEKTISIRGQFISDNSLTVTDYHIHSRFRDFASYIGLMFVAGFWMVSGAVFIFGRYHKSIQKKNRR
jgi:hypothetical protein